MKEPLIIYCAECEERFEIYDDEQIQDYLAGIEFICDKCQSESD